MQVRYGHRAAKRCQRYYQGVKSAAFILFLVHCAHQGRAATFTVDQTSNTGPGSLPVVLAQAGGIPGDHTIEFTAGGTITLSSPLPPITNSLIFQRVADQPVTISGGGTVPLFHFAGGTTNRLVRLILIDGKGRDGGAAIRNDGMLAISDCVLTNHQAMGGSGGAIRNSGQLTIDSSILSANHAAGGGGAIHNSGSLTLSGSSLAGNQAGNGGALYNQGTMILNQLTLSSNQAVLGLGGAIYSEGELQVEACTFNRNRAVGGQGEDSGGEATGGNPGGGGAGLGGGVFVAGGSAGLTNCTISGNAAVGGAGGDALGGSLRSGRGGGNEGGEAGRELTVPSWSQLIRIGAPGGPGGFGSGGGGGGEGNYKGPGGPGGFGGGGGGGGGAGTYLGPIRDPRETGGPGPAGYAGGAGGTGFHSYESGGGGGGAGLGGGIFVKSGQLALLNCTIASNSVSGGEGGINRRGTGSPGQPGQGIGGGIFNWEGAAGLTNVIVAGNVSAQASPDLSGRYLSSGNNLIGQAEGAEGLDLKDIQNEPAHLGPLRDNGGPTFTHALLQGSLAIGRGTSNTAPALDQRGFSRIPGPVDIGAYQLAPRAIPEIAWTDPADIVYGTPLGGQQLNATVEIEGALHYIPPEDTILPAGSNQVLTVVFIPDDLIRYHAATNSVIISVNQASQAIAFDPIPNQQTNGPAVPLRAEASSGLPVIFEMVSGPAEIENDRLHPGPEAGLVTVRASQPGNTNYLAAPAVEQSFLVGPLPWPAISLQPGSQTARPGEKATFQVEAIHGPLTYQWRWAGEVMEGATSAKLVLARVRPSQAGPYDVIVRNTSGSVTSAVAILSVEIPEGNPVIVTPPRDLNIKAGETALLSVVARGPAPLLYQWYRGSSGETNGLIAGATNATYTAASLTNHTSFWVSARNEVGLVDSEPALVTVFPASAARLKLQMLGGRPGLTISGVPGATYRIEYRSNLEPSEWTKWLDLILPANPFTFFDPKAPESARFYRAVGP